MINSAGVWSVAIGIFEHYLVEHVSRLGEGHRNAGAHVAAGSVAVGQAGYRPLSLQRGQTHLNRLAKQQHSFGQRVAETGRPEGNGYCGSFITEMDVEWSLLPCISLLKGSYNANFSVVLIKWNR